MINLLEQAIGCDDPLRAARIIQEALGIESDERLRRKNHKPRNVA
jgi:hypothetical protein